jgi:glutathione reductase (NADPH)
MAPTTFDLVVIGTGSAASTVASRCRSEGWQVAVVDSRPFGGTCALRGCDPKKVLVAAAEAMDWTRRMAGRGVAVENARIPWRDLAGFKRTFTDDVARKKEDGFAKQGIAAFHGRARFVGPRTLEVGRQKLEGRHVLIATGARPASLGIPGEENLTTSDAFLELEEIPKQMAFVGGGYISFEFAHVAARAGAKATILHRGERPLEGFDPDLVDQLIERTRGLGIDLQLETTVKSIEKRAAGAAGLAVKTSSPRGSGEFAATMAVHGAGRVAEIDDLDLPKAGVEQERGGIKVNEFLQSVSNPAIYAAGDSAATSGPPLTPVAGYEGRVVVANLLKGNHLKPDYSGIPSVVFTVPPLAKVGLHEAEARDRGLHFKSKLEDTSSWYSSRRIGETCSGFKVLTEEESGRILGAHLLGPGCEELINLFALAIRHQLPAAALKETLFAYPTHASDIAYML